MSSYHVGIPLPLGLSTQVRYPIYDQLGTLQAYVKNPDLADKIVSKLNGEDMDDEDLESIAYELRIEIDDLQDEKSNLEMTIESLSRQLEELRKEKEEVV